MLGLFYLFPDSTPPTQTSCVPRVWRTAQHAVCLQITGSRCCFELYCGTIWYFFMHCTVVIVNSAAVNAPILGCWNLYPSNRLRGRRLAQRGCDLKLCSAQSKSCSVFVSQKGRPSFQEVVIPANINTANARSSYKTGTQLPPSSPRASPPGG